MRSALIASTERLTADWRAKKAGEAKESDDLGAGSLFATGLVAGGALMISKERGPRIGVR